MPELPYAPEALAPKMSRETLDYHYGKHLQTYVDNLNRLIPGTPYAEMPLDEIVRRADGAVFNNAAQAWPRLAGKTVGLFGSGWVWLAADRSGNLSIVAKPNAGNPMTDGLRPVLTIDVWEHAYYIDYRNRRADFVAAWWELVDWRKVADRAIPRRYKCTACDYVYDPAKGDPETGIAPGTPFEEIPDDWACPLCGLSKDAFRPMEE